MILISDYLNCFVSTMPALTLKELCYQNVVKYGVAWEVLPEILVKEIEKMELNIMSVFNGRFSSVEDYAGNELTISWRAGEWRFNMQNQETIRIVAGVDNDLGTVGGTLFRFPHREVTISDFQMDIDNRELRFEGICSSTKNVAGRHIVSTLKFSKFRHYMMMKTTLTSLNGVEVKKKEILFTDSNSWGYGRSYWLVVDRGLDSGSDESDSSVDH